MPPRPTSPLHDDLELGAPLLGAPQRRADDGKHPLWDFRPLVSLLFLVTGFRSRCQLLWRVGLAGFLLLSVWLNVYSMFVTGLQYGADGEELPGYYSMLLAGLFLTEILGAPVILYLALTLPVDRLPPVLEPALAVPRAAQRLRRRAGTLAALAAFTTLMSLGMMIETLRRNGLLDLLFGGTDAGWSDEISAHELLVYRLETVTNFFAIFVQMGVVACVVTLFHLSAVSSQLRLERLSWRVARGEIATVEEAFEQYCAVRDDTARLAELWAPRLCGTFLLLVPAMLVLFALVVASPDGEVGLVVSVPSIFLESFTLVLLAHNISRLNSGGVRLMRTVLRSSAWTPEERHFLAHDIDCVPLTFDIYGYRITAAAAGKIVAGLAVFGGGCGLAMASS